MYTDPYIAIWSGAIGSILAFIGSVTAAILVWRSSSKQRALQEKLQSDSQAFDLRIKQEEEASAKRIETFTKALESKQNIESIRIKELLEAVSKSRASTKGAVESFKSLVKKSHSADDRDFLTEFQKAIIALNAFGEGLESLEHLVRPKDLIIFKNTNKHFLQILLGMRLEKERRELPDFKDKTIAYTAFLDRAENLINAKYRSVLQPRTVGETAAQQGIRLGAPETAGHAD